MQVPFRPRTKPGVPGELQELVNHLPAPSQPASHPLQPIDVLHSAEVEEELEAEFEPQVKRKIDPRFVGWADSRYPWALVGSFVAHSIIHFQGGDLAQAAFSKTLPIVATVFAIVLIKNKRWWAFQLVVQVAAANYLVQAITGLIFPTKLP